MISMYAVGVGGAPNSGFINLDVLLQHGRILCFWLGSQHLSYQADSMRLGCRGGTAGAFL